MITIDTPAAFWGLAAILVVVLLSLWRHRPREVGVGSLRLWREIPDRRPPLREARRPRWSWVTFWQAAAVAAGVAALAGPVWRSGRPTRGWVLAIDDSASLLARREDGRTRWDHARDAVKRMIGVEDRVILLTMSPRYERVEADGAGALRRLEAMEPSECGEIDLSLLAAAARAEARRAGFRAVMVSDHKVEGIDTIAGGGPAGNLGWTACGVERGRDGGWDVYIGAFNTGAARRETVVIDTGTGESRIERDFPAGETAWIEHIDVDAPHLRFGLPPDGFPCDDEIVAVRSSSVPVRVGYFGDEHPLLERAVRAAGNVEWTAGKEGAYDLYIYYRREPERAPPGVTVLIDPPGRSVTLSGEVVNPSITLPVDQPLTRGVSPEEVILPSARAIRSMVGDVSHQDPLFMAGGESIAAAGYRDGRLVNVILAFPLAYEGWAATPSFPIFWSNVVAAARPGSGERWDVLRTGQAAAGGSGLRAVRHRGTQKPVDVIAVGNAKWWTPRRTGFYDLEGGPAREAYANLLDPEESALRWDRAAPPEGGPTLPAPGRPLAGAMIALCAACMMAAWVAERRS